MLFLPFFHLISTCASKEGDGKALCKDKMCNQSNICKLVLSNLQTLAFQKLMAKHYAFQKVMAKHYAFQKVMAKHYALCIKHYAYMQR